MTTEESAILVTTLGATHIIARPLLGLIGTKESSMYGKQVVYAGASLLGSFACFVSIWFDSMATQVLFVVIFGITSGKLKYDLFKFFSSVKIKLFFIYFSQQNTLCLLTKQQVKLCTCHNVIHILTLQQYFEHTNFQFCVISLTCMILRKLPALTIRVLDLEYCCLSLYQV